MNMRAIPYQRSRAKPADQPMILRNLRQIKLDKFGYPTIDSRVVDGSRDQRWFVPIPGLPVWEFELYFANSYRLYSIEHVRARDMRAAKRKIVKQYPHVIRFKWDMLEEKVR